MSILNIFKKEKNKEVVIQECENKVIHEIADNQHIQICNKFPEFVNWNKNRPPDEIRIRDIKEYYVRNNISFIPGIIYAWDNNKELEIYDGIHRIIAAHELYITDNKQFTFLLHIIKTQNEDIIIENFKSINKSCPVPLMYTELDEQINLIKRVVCENVVSELCNKYNNFLSPSRKPYRYNFNRDVTLEFFSELEIDWNIKGLSNIILQEIYGLNFIAKDFVSRNNIQCPKKCQFYNFYLWFLEKGFIKEKLENALKKYE